MAKAELHMEQLNPMQYLDRKLAVYHPPLAHDDLEEHDDMEEADPDVDNNKVEYPSGHVDEDDDCNEDDEALRFDDVFNEDLENC